MGMTFIINKLGTILRVLKVRRKKHRHLGDISDITSSSEIEAKTSDSSNDQKKNILKSFPNLWKSKSINSISLAVDVLPNEFNELKRTHGTSNIFERIRDVQVNCSKSLCGLRDLEESNNYIFSYNAKTHDLTAWSQPYGKIIASTEKDYGSMCRQDTPNESDEAVYYDTIESKISAPIKTVFLPNAKVDEATNARSALSHVSSQKTKISTTNYKEEGSTVQTVKNISNIHPSSSQECNSSDIGANKRSSLIRKVSMKNFSQYREFQIRDNRSINCSLSEETSSSPQIIIPQPLPNVVDKHRTGVKMEVETVKNLEGFDLRKYDVKSSGDHLETTRSPIENYVDLDYSKHPLADIYTKQNRGYDANSTISNTTSLIGNQADYEVVNLAQIDVFKEFKSTIAKMRSVLNVLEVEKSLQHTTEGNQKNICQDVNTVKQQKNANISTQTVPMTYNQISTSTDEAVSTTRKNESVMVQLSSDKCNTNSKNITLDSALFNYMKPLEQINRRRKYKKVRPLTNDKIKRRSNQTVTSGLNRALRIPMKPDKSQYNKCVVYHITQHKDAMDRCVGTSPSISKKSNIVIHNTFSALHFGPINQFPALLNKHENEENKSKQLKSKSKIPSKKQINSSISSKMRSSSFMSLGDLGPIQENIICHKSKTQPSLSTFESEESPYSSINPTTANWFVFEPTPPIVIQDSESTSEQLVNNSSTQEIVSKLIEEELRISGLRGKVSSSTVNLIKDQFCDKLNGINPKDVSNVMITICVPLKEIVSKIKASNKPSYENETSSTEVKKASSLRVEKKKSCDMGVQVKVPRDYTKDNLQTIPEKMCRKATEIYQHNKNVRQSTSHRKLSTFKKKFGHKATSCASIHPFFNVPQQRHKIYFSDRSTSSPEFQSENVALDPLRFSDKSVTAGLKSSSDKAEECQIDQYEIKQCESFFLNLPRNRYKHKRAQISKLFEGSDSSGQYFEDSKLLYQVHDSSLYSSSRTDNRLTPQISPHKPSNLTSSESLYAPYFPIQQTASNIDIKVKPKFISFSDLPNSNGNEFPEKNGDVEDKPTKKKENRGKSNKKKFKNVRINTLKENRYLDNETQCETIHNPLKQEFEDSKKEENDLPKVSVETETFFNNCVDEFSGIAKVHFEDEDFDDIYTKVRLEEGKNRNKCSKYNKNVIVQENIKCNSNEHISVLSLFADTKTQGEVDIKNKNNERNGTLQNDQVVSRNDYDNHYYNVDANKEKRPNVMLQTYSVSNITVTKTEAENTGRYTPDQNNNNQLTSHELVNIDFRHAASRTLSKNENYLVPIETNENIENENNLSGLVKDIVDIYNSSFERSRDCIVELTLCNLIKEIVLEHCSHFTEQSKVRIESILANFMKESKCKSENKDVNIVESAIENLVKEIETNCHINANDILEDDLIKDHERKHKHNHEDNESEREHKSRTKSKHRGHKHGSKKRSRHRENEEIRHDKHRHKNEEAKTKFKDHHKHHCDNQVRCDLGKEKARTEYHTLKGKREYKHLVQRLTELEEITKQLSTAAQNREVYNSLTDRWRNETENPFRRCNQVYTSLNEDKYKSSKTKKNFSQLQKTLSKEYANIPLSLNYMQTNPLDHISPIPRNFPRIPLTKIVINLSNLRLLTRNCVNFMSTKVKPPIVITDSTEEKQEFIKEIIAYEIGTNRKKTKHNSYHSLRRARRKFTCLTKARTYNKNEESFTITIQGRGAKLNMEKNYYKPIKKNKDFMRVKMMKKNTITSASKLKVSDTYITKKDNDEDIESNNIDEISKECFRSEYKFNGHNACEKFASSLLRNRFNINQGLNDEENLDSAYHRMANFCLFRGILRKNFI